MVLKRSRNILPAILVNCSKLNLDCKITPQPHPGNSYGMPGYTTKKSNIFEYLNCHRVSQRFEAVGRLKFFWSEVEEEVVVVVILLLIL